MSAKSQWLLIILLAGCSLGGAPRGAADGTPTPARAASEPQIVRTETGISALIAADVEHSGDAAVAGSLEVLGGRCLGVRVGRSSYLVAWPFGTDILGSNPLELVLPNGGILEEGDLFEGAGGFHSAPLPDSVPTIPKECPPHEEILLLSVVNAL